MPTHLSDQILFWRNGRVVECTGLENQRGSHLRGFESLFLRKEKAETRVSAFFISEICEKLAFLRIEGIKKGIAIEDGAFLCSGFPSGITASNPLSESSLS